MKKFSAVALLFFLTFSVIGQETTRPKQPDLPGDLMIDFGFSRWSDKPDLLQSQLIGSPSFSIFYNQRFRMSDRLSFYPAVGFTFDKYGFEGDYSWFRQDDGSIQIDTLFVPLAKNKLAMTYFEIPLELRIHPLGTVGGEGWFIGLGVVGGVRLNSHTKVKYQLADDVFKEKLYSGFDTNLFRYGVQARFGFKTVHLFYKMYFNDLFQNAPDASGVNPTVTTFGINFSGF